MPEPGVLSLPSLPPSGSQRQTAGWAGTDPRPPEQRRWTMTTGRAKPEKRVPGHGEAAAGRTGQAPTSARRAGKGFPKSGVSEWTPEGHGGISFDTTCTKYMRVIQGTKDRCSRARENSSSVLHFVRRRFPSLSNKLEGVLLCDGTALSLMRCWGRK